MDLKRLSQNPGPYLTKLKYYFGGLYFDWVLKDYRVENCSFEVPSAYTERQDRGYFAFGTYEKAECDIIKKLITRDCKVLELGGCIGVVSCITNRLLDHPAHHVVVEANPNLIPIITRNRDRNKCQFKVENCVIASQKQVDFFIGENMVLGSICQSQGTRVKVNGLTFAEVEFLHSVCFDTIIMDIEGAEYDLIKDNVPFFSRMQNVILENHPSINGAARVSEYEAQLRAVGFTKACEVGQVAAWRKTRN